MGLLWVVLCFSNYDCETQWRYLQTTILATANKEGGKGEGEGQLVTRKQYLGLKTTAQLPRGSTQHLKLGETRMSNRGE